MKFYLHKKNLDFTNYTNIIKAGDKDYLKHVLRYLSDYDDGIKIKYVDDNGNICENNVTILPSKNKVRSGNMSISKNMTRCENSLSKYACKK